ncbi:MAG: tetratricopeptide repeat protein [Crocinitomicaceae bacterium]|nr:tetratricopeptide repeat protein [Crocinitomicaceae bacterium]
MIRNSIYILLVALLAVSCGTEKNVVERQTLSSKDYPYIEKFHKGIRLKATGRVDEAVKTFEECLIMRQDDDAVYYALSQLELMRENKDLSAQHIKKASELDPNNIWYTQELAYMNFEQGNFDEAVKGFGILVEKEPKNVEWLYGYAEALVKAGQTSKAIEAFDKMEEQLGGSPQLSIQKYSLYMSAKESDKAINELKEARKKFPNDAQLIANMVDHYFRNGEQAKATEMLKELVKADPDNGRARLALADIYRQQGDEDKAYEELRLAFDSDNVSIDTKMKILINIHESGGRIDDEVYELVESMVVKYPEEAKAHSIRGDYMLRKENEGEALKSYKNALKYDKSQYPIWNQVLIMEYQRGENEALYIDSKECLSLFPTIPTIYLLNGVGANQTKRYEEAIESLSVGKELVISDKPMLAEFYGQLGDANFGLKSFNEGKKYYSKAIETDKNSLLIKNNYAYRLAISSIDLELSESLILQVLEQAPTQAEFLDTYGFVLFQQKKYEEAKKQLQNAQALNSDDAAIADHLGDAYFKMNDVEQAVKWWIKSKELGNKSRILDKKIEDKKYYALEI